MTILMYHQIADLPASRDPARCAISPAVFDQHMASLHRRGFRCVDLAQAVRSGRGRPPKTVALTFDDGFEDLYTTAWPILDRYGFTATLFTVVGRVGQRSDWQGQSGPLAAPLLTWARLDELARHGFTIGSHTLSHPRLSMLPRDAAARELRESKQTIEDRLGRACEYLAYPYSDRSPLVQAVAAEAGYRAACSGDRGRWDVFNLWRVQCWRGEPPWKFALKANGWFDRLIWLREETRLGKTLRPIVRAGKRLARSTRRPR